jgi:PAS domain-containing protein
MDHILMVQLNFGDAEFLASACTRGPDAAAFAAARKCLCENGVPFEIEIRTADDEIIVARGRPIAGHAVLFLRSLQTPMGIRTKQQEMDWRHTLDALAVPAWLRDADLNLVFVNRAFMELTGAASCREATMSGVALDRSERDLAAAARDTGQPITAMRYAVIGNARRPFSFSLRRTHAGGVMGAAFDLAPAANSAQQHQLDAFGATLHRLTDAVAIFGPDHRLSFCNRAYAQLWDLPRAWLDTCPTLSLILDRLRETGRLPEQHDFGAWKSIQLAAFGSPELCSEELWHVPSGRSLRVVWQPHPSGGVTVLFQDITDRLTSESILKAQYKVQRATLEIFPEAAAIFGPDGRHRLCNSAFLRLWHLGEEVVSGNPHMARVAAHCQQHFGDDGIWSLVSESINSAGSKEKREAIEVMRSDGRVLSIVLARLPDGATLAGFHDVSDLRRLEAALRATAA